MPENRTAILIFSRNAQEEFRYKSWGLNFVKFSQVHQTLVNKVRYTAALTGLPVFEADSSVQQGVDFGSRLLSAIDWVKASGYQKLIIVGNDSPGLNKSQLLKAKRLLDQGQSVLGRDSHGGAYLIGFDINQISEQDLLNIDWQTARVFRQLYASLGQVVVLKETQIDLNSPQDLKALSKVKPSTLIHFIWSLVFDTVQSLSFAAVKPRVIFSALFPHRGPPVMA